MAIKVELRTGDGSEWVSGDCLEPLEPAVLKGGKDCPWAAGEVVVRVGACLFSLTRGGAGLLSLSGWLVRRLRPGESVVITRAEG